MTSYNVYRGTSASNEGTVAIGSTTLTSYSDTTANAGTTYYYKVAAVNGTGTGAQSGESSALTIPAMPTGLGATPISATQINLSWTTPGGTVTSYNVYRGTSAGGEGTTAIGSTTLTSYSDTTASAGTTYYYKVAAVNGTGTGAQSGESSALTIPAMPTGLGATPISATQINLSWTTPGGTVTSYNVYRSTSAGERGDCRNRQHHPHLLQRHHRQRRHDLLLQGCGGKRHGHRRCNPASPAPDDTGGSDGPDGHAGFGLRRSI